MLFVKEYNTFDTCGTSHVCDTEKQGKSMNNIRDLFPFCDLTISLPAPFHRQQSWESGRFAEVQQFTCILGAEGNLCPHIFLCV